MAPEVSPMCLGRARSDNGRDPCRKSPEPRLTSWPPLGPPRGSEPLAPQRGQRRPAGLRREQAVQQAPGELATGLGRHLYLTW